MKLLDGKPIFLHTLEKIANMQIFDEVWLDTESDQIIEAATHVNCKVMKRDPELATNKTDGHQLFLNEVKHTDADIVLQILGTSPFISEDTITRTVQVLIENPQHDSAVLVQRAKQYTWINERPAYNFENIPNSKDLPETIIESMGLYAVRREVALETGKRIGNKPYLIDASPLDAIDVNWPADFELANLIAAGKRERERNLFQNLCAQLSTAMLSDVMDDLGISENQLVFGLISNQENGRLFARAKTLRLRAIKEGEDFTGIYEALQSYATIIPNDVIVVENEVPDCAYFGELNANLAVRCGAAGAIIGGTTRDNEQVKRLNFQTFSTGYVGRDVRKRAVVDTINQPISLMGVTVNPGDLIFADSEGVAVIPQQYEKAVLDEMLKRLKNERNILLTIAEGGDIQELVNSFGFF